MLCFGIFNSPRRLGVEVKITLNTHFSLNPLRRLLKIKLRSSDLQSGQYPECGD